MLTRKAEKKINKWIENGKKALLVDGARQVGKTFTIRHCLQSSGVDHIEINLLEDSAVRQALTMARSVRDLVINLSAVTGHTFKKGETILFIDEVQELPEIVTMIKFWVDEGSYRYILSGSLLGIELNALRSAPVGYVQELQMVPLDFEEFMIASGVNDVVIRRIETCFKERTPVGEPVHGKMMQLFHRYLVVGGMPEAVQEYVDTGNIGTVGSIQKDIIRYYKRDFTKYEAQDARLMITSVYETIPAELLKQNRRFNYADIKKGLRFERIEQSFVWLYKAGVVVHAFNATEPKIALKLNEKNSLVKLYYADVGLLTCACDDAVRRSLLLEEAGPNLGGIYENAVIQELTAHGFAVYYYNSKKLGELDFVIEYQGAVLPIEVKSGKDYYVHSAINHVLENRDFGIPEAMVLSGFDVSSDGKIQYFPIYMVGFLKPEPEEDLIVSPITF